jgi:hypothetical protein
MTRRPPVDLAASVRQRLLNVARGRGENFQRTLTRYGLERLLYQLSTSPHRDRFLLKGAVLLTAWRPEAYRATKDLDLLGRGDPSPESLVELFRSLCAIPAESDGLTFQPNSVRAAPIREAEQYGGLRVTLLALLGNARIPLQVDIGFGDVVTPGPTEVEVPTLLGAPPLRLLGYPRETVVAEKLHAMVVLGLGNSRMRDFFDVWALARDFDFTGRTLAAAICATFTRRGTPVPAGAPIALTPVFSADVAKQIQWRAFIRRSLPAGGEPELREVIEALADFLLPIIRAVRSDVEWTQVWPAGGPWTEAPESDSSVPDH